MMVSLTVRERDIQGSGTILVVDYDGRWRDSVRLLSPKASVRDGDELR